MVFAIIFKVPELKHSSAGVLVRISHHEGHEKSRLPGFVTI